MSTENENEEIQSNKYEAESQKMLNYINGYYAKKVREPKPPTDKDLSFRKLAGFETLSFAIPAVAIALFSAVRTGQFFYILEVLMLDSYSLFPKVLSGTIGFIVALLALFGFEGVILARGIKSGRKKVIESGDNVEVEGRGLGIAFAFLIILSIGVFSSLELVENIDETLLLWINIYMIVITGAGATVLVYHGGDDIGIAYENYNVKARKLIKSHKDEYDDWWEGAVRSWNTVKGKSGKTTQSEPAQNNTPVPTEKPKSWRTLRPLLPISDVVYLSKLNDEREIEELAKNEDVDVKTIKNRIGYAVRELSADTATVLDNMISIYSQFPTNQELTLMELDPREVASYIVSNETSLLSEGLIDEALLNQARELV